MNKFLKPVLSSSILKPSKICMLSKHTPRFAHEVGHWNKDYKPGKYPKTFEERMRAAAKYNLHIEDYEPNEDGRYYGDYPKLPYNSEASRDPYYPWDSPENKRNFGEPFHTDADHYGECFYDIDKYYTLRPSFWIQVAQFFGACALFGATILVFEKCKMFPGVAPKQFPGPDITHYTFETCTEEEEIDTESETKPENE